MNPEANTVSIKILNAFSDKTVKLMIKFIFKFMRLREIFKSLTKKKSEEFTHSFISKFPTK